MPKPRPVADRWSIPIGQIADELSDGVIVIGDRNQIVHANTAFDRLLGYRRGETIGLSIDEVIVDRWRFMHLPNKRDTLIDFSSMVRKSIATPVSTGERMTVRDKYGASIPVHIIRRTTGEAQSPSIVLVMRDLRDESDKMARARLTAVIGAAEDAIYSTSLDGTLLSWSPAAERLYGYTAAEIIGQSTSLLIPPERTEEMDAIIARLTTGGRVARFETTRVAKDGHRVWVSLNAAPIRDADGTIVGASVIVRDITAIKLTEATLDRRQVQMDAILDAAREAMVLIAPDGSIAKANRRFCELLGLDADDQARCVGAPLLTLSDAFRQRFGDDGLRALTAVTLAGKDAVATIALHQTWPEVHEFELSIAAVPGGDGEDFGHLYSFLDVTRERELDRLKRDFVATVSHEMRTPLTAISGFVDLMVNGSAGELTARLQYYLGIVQTNNRRLTAIIDDLLDISRIEAGKVNLSRQTMDIATTIGAVVASFEPQLRTKKQSLLLDLPVRMPHVWADPARVEQILANLLSNAHKYTPDGGAITIATRLERDALRIEMIDTGIGLTPSEQERLFTKFFRSSNPDARLVSGTGLGLAITKSLVELHDGTMTVISAPGQGSMFAFTLPFAPGEEETSKLSADARDAYLMTPLQPALSRSGKRSFETGSTTMSDQSGSPYVSAPRECAQFDVMVKSQLPSTSSPLVTGSRACAQ